MSAVWSYFTVSQTNITQAIFNKCQGKVASGGRYQIKSSAKASFLNQAFGKGAQGRACRVQTTECRKTKNSETDAKPSMDRAHLHSRDSEKARGGTRKLM